MYRIVTLIPGKSIIVIYGLLFGLKVLNRDFNTSCCYTGVTEVLHKCNKALQSVTKRYKALQSVTKCYKALQSVTKRYKVLQSVTKCYKVLQSVTKCYTGVTDTTRVTTKSWDLLTLQKDSGMRVDGLCKFNIGVFNEDIYQ